MVEPDEQEPTDGRIEDRLEREDGARPTIPNPQSEIRNSMTPAEFRRRLKEFALRAIRLTQSLPNDPVARAIKGQLVRSGTSPGADYRAACRARSRAEFVAKMGIVEEELDESLYWMDLLTEADFVRPEKLESLMAEGEELLSMTVASIKTARPRRK